MRKTRTKEDLAKDLANHEARMQVLNRRLADKNLPNDEFDVVVAEYERTARRVGKLALSLALAS